MIRDRITDFRRVTAANLRADPANWRKHPQHQRAALQGVLDEIGYADALLARETPDGLMLIDGHLRADLDPDAEVPVLVVDLDEDEAHKLMATLDPLAAMAETDQEALDALLQSIESENDAVNALLESLATPPEPASPVDDPGPQIDRAEELQAKWGTEYGQLWQIGRHRLLCGDSQNVAHMKRLVGEDAPPLVFTSPPYAAQRTYEIGEFDWDALMQGVFQSVGECVSADASIIVNLGMVHQKGRVNRYWDTWLNWMEDYVLPLYGWYVWDQGWGLMGDWAGRLAPSHEFLFHFAANPRHANKTQESSTAGQRINGTMRKADGSLKPLTQNGQVRGTHKIPDSIVRVNRQIGPLESGDHPAVFSVDLPAYCIPIWTEQEDSVLDPFCGSGTTMVAAEQLGRTCYALEIEPKYVAVTLERMAGMGLEPKDHSGKPHGT